MDTDQLMLQKLISNEVTILKYENLVQYSKTFCDQNYWLSYINQAQMSLDVTHQ